MADKKSGRIVGRSHGGSRTSLLKSRKTRRAEQAIAGANRSGTDRQTRQTRHEDAREWDRPGPSRRSAK